MNHSLAFIAMTALCCSPILAQTQHQPSSASSPVEPKVEDPDRKVCEKIVKPGTKADIRRVCATSAEWAEMRRRDREWTESIQRSVCVRGGGC